MKIYFLADIFLGDQTGIYRYSHEVASAFLKNNDIKLKFVSNGYSDILLLEDTIEKLFGDRSLLIREGHLLGFRYKLTNKYKSIFQSYKTQHKNTQKYIFKILREIFRIFKIFGVFRISKILKNMQDL